MTEFWLSAALLARDARHAVMLFILCGLWFALVWARLGTPDLALAEAAIGAGLGGALMLAAARHEAPPRPVRRPRSPCAPSSSR